MKNKAWLVAFVLIILFIFLNFKYLKTGIFNFLISFDKEKKLNFLITSAQNVLNTLKVQSDPASSVPISADDPAYSGTTNYLKQSDSNISTWLSAPINYSYYSFNCWDGCDAVDGNRCLVSVTDGITQVVTAYYQPFDLSTDFLNIRSFICKNSSFDQSYWNEFSVRNPNYPYAPSTTYAVKFYNEVAKDTCPESQRNRPVEFSASGTCLQGNCPPSKLRIYIRPQDVSANPYETKTFETTYDANYPKSITAEYTFDNAYDYKVTACFVDQNNQPVDDVDNSNNCKELNLRIFDYFCYYGFSAQSQRDWTKQPPIKILKIFGLTDSPTRYWRNEICRARFGF